MGGRSAHKHTGGMYLGMLILACLWHATLRTWFYGAGGRNLVIKNSVMALAWFLVQHQVPPDLDHMMDEWYKLSWDFFESGAHVKVSLTSSPPTRQTGRGHNPIVIHILRARFPEFSVDVKLFPADI